jgi:hypothetical protein
MPRTVPGALADTTFRLTLRFELALATTLKYLGRDHIAVNRLAQTMKNLTLSQALV